MQHQEDDTLLGVIWCDLPHLGVFGRIGHLGLFAKTRQLTQVSMLFAMFPQVVGQVHTKSNAKSTTHDRSRNQIVMMVVVLLALCTQY